MRRSDDTLRSRDASFQETDRWQDTIYVPDWAMGIIVGVLAAVVVLAGPVRVQVANALRRQDVHGRRSEGKEVSATLRSPYRSKVSGLRRLCMHGLAVGWN
jgi:hypothetical protein